MYTYEWRHWLSFFYFYCFFGWAFESAFVSLKKRRLVNRGFLHSPMLPLYGTGAIMMLWVSLPVKDNPFLVYISGVIAATILEYITGYVMERLFKIKYWDYSNQKFHLHGYICLSSSIAWGFLTILMTEVIHEPIEAWILQMNPYLNGTLLTVITIIFVTDVIQSTRDAFDLAHALEAMTKLRREMDELQVQIALLKAEISQDIQEKLDEHEDRLLEFCQSQEEKIQAFKQTQETRIREFRESQELHIHTLTQNLEERRVSLQHHLTVRRRNILRRNPSASSRQFTHAIRELREFLDEKHR